VLGWVGAAVAVLVLPVLPQLWRSRVRGRRLASRDPLEAWRELGDAAWDVGIPPDGALSPRRAAARVAELGRLEPEAAGAVLRVAGAVERALYAPPGAQSAYEDLAGDVLLVRAALLAGVSRGTRLRALLLPRSAARLRWAATARWTAVASRAATVSAAVTSRASALRLPLRDRG
jgi:hypothetical protein